MYGTVPVSFLATRALNQLASDFRDKFPLGVSKICSDFYMDDFISGYDNLEEATKIRDQVTAILKTGGFELRKWASNNNRKI